MDADSVIERIWEETGKAIASCKGGWIVFPGGYWPIDFDGDRSYTIYVDNQAEAKVALWFWRPDACKETFPLVLHWMNLKGMNVEQFNSDLSDNLLQFRNDFKDKLWQMARNEISQLKPSPVKITKVPPKTEESTEKSEVKKKHPLKSKTIWTGAATAGTGTAALFAHLDPKLSSLLMIIYGFLTIIWRLMTKEPVV